MSGVNLREMDPRGLFDDSFRIKGVTERECRSIFLDWAIGVPAEQDARSWVKLIHAYYRTRFPLHPMTKILAEGLGKATNARGRGRRTAKPRPG